MSDTELQLADIPDLSGVSDSQTDQQWTDGWYEGLIIEQRQFTDSNGNDRVFETVDLPSAKGDSRNIRLQTVLKRRSDGRTLGTSVQINYRPEDLTAETVQAVTTRAAEGGQKMGDLFRPFLALQRLGRLQKIAGVRQLQRNGNGGLDLTPTYNKSAYFRLGPDERTGGKYREVKDFQVEPPKRGAIL